MIAKVATVLALVAVCLAQQHGYGPKKVVHGTAYGHGQSYQQDRYESPKPYQFGFDIKDDYNNQITRQETGDDYGNVQGSYGYQDANGLYRQVEYTADDYGFKAHVKTNEPGTANKNPADVEMYADPIEVKYDAPKHGYQNTHKAVVAHSGSYQTPVYGHRATGSAAPSYGHRATGYGHASHVTTHQTGYAAPSYGHRATGYGHASHVTTHQTGYAAPSYGHRATGYGHGVARVSTHQTGYAAPARHASYAAPVVHTASQANDYRRG